MATATTKPSTIKRAHALKKEGLAYQAIARKLNDEGHRTARGKLIDNTWVSHFLQTKRLKQAQRTKTVDAGGAQKAKVLKLQFKALKSGTKADAVEQAIGQTAPEPINLRKAILNADDIDDTKRVELLRILES